MYKLKNSKQRTGYKGKLLTDENVNSYPDRLKKIWLAAGIVKEVKQTNRSK
jgi:hypothetical protein